MGKINILSAELSNKIAAGEVVEWPSSVVNELVENSIDAGSKNIKIIIQEFGIKQLSMIDKGSGISNDDLEKKTFKACFILTSMMIMSLFISKKDITSFLLLLITAQSYIYNFIFQTKETTFYYYMLTFS